MSVRKFKITWGSGYEPTAPQVHELDWFSEDMGFREDDRRAIENLIVGEVHSTGGFTDEVSIERVA